MESKESMYVPEDKTEKYGSNVEISVMFVRHGEKQENQYEKGGITELGLIQAVELGSSLDEKDAIKGYSSPADRALETIDNIINSSPTDHKLNIRKRLELQDVGLRCSKDFVGKLRSIVDQNMPSNWRELPNDEIKEAKFKAQNEIAKYYISFNETRPDSETESPEEIAEGIAYLVNKYINMADRLYSDSEVDLINGTHGLITETYLLKALLKSEDGKLVKAFNSVDEMGGILRPAESWNLTVKTDDTGEKKVICNFRDQEYFLDTELTRHLANNHIEKSRGK